MEFEEILKYKPSLEHVAEDDDDAAAAAGPSSERGGKRKRHVDDDGGEGGITEEERKRILEMLAAEPDDQDEEGLDEAQTRRLALALEKRVTKNTELRIKFASEPQKFMDSELELHGQLQELQVLATAPDLYPQLVKLGTVGTLVGLLGHENTDITVAVIDLLKEMTEGDVIEESLLGANLLIEALLKEQFLQILVDCVQGLNESQKEEAEGVHHAMGIVENMLEIQPALGEKLLKETSFLDWSLGRLQSREFDDNKLYCSELLAILLQDNTENRRLFGDKDAMEVMLRCVSGYRRDDPASAEEVEMMENLFDVMCSALQYENNLDKFLEAEGVELMVRILKAKKISRFGALKVLDHALSWPAGKEACITFVRHLGLKSLFPAFMKTPTAKATKKLGYNENQFEEHVCSIIVSLLVNLCEHEEFRPRVLSKFVEQDMIKINRLAELHHKYRTQVAACEASLQQEKTEAVADGADEEYIKALEDQHYLRRIDAGLYTLQLVDHILAEACYGCGSEVAKRMDQLLKLKGDSLEATHAILTEYADNFDGENTPAERVKSLIPYVSATL